MLAIRFEIISYSSNKKPIHVSDLTPTFSPSANLVGERPRSSRVQAKGEDIEVVCEITTHVVAALH